MQKVIISVFMAQHAVGLQLMHEDNAMPMVHGEVQPDPRWQNYQAFIPVTSSHPVQQLPTPSAPPQHQIQHPSSLRDEIQPFLHPPRVKELTRSTPNKLDVLPQQKKGFRAGLKRLFSAK